VSTGTETPAFAYFLALIAFVAGLAGGFWIYGAIAG